MRREHKAFNHRGEPVLLTWTETLGAHEAERAAFQQRLNRCELLYVDIFDPETPDRVERLFPQRSAQV